MALLPLRRNACCGFLSPLKILCPRPGLKPWIFGPMASTLTTRPPRRTYDSISDCDCPLQLRRLQRKVSLHRAQWVHINKMATAFEQSYALVNLISTIPASTASVERSISALKILKIRKHCVIALCYLRKPLACYQVTGDMKAVDNRKEFRLEQWDKNFVCDSFAWFLYIGGSVEIMLWLSYYTAQYRHYCCYYYYCCCCCYSLSVLYTTVVRPKMENAFDALNSITSTDSYKLERVQWTISA
jgi:hypothetical protein